MIKTLPTKPVEKATIIYQNGIGKEPEIISFDVIEPILVENIWETIDNIHEKLKESNLSRPMAVGDLIKLEYVEKSNYSGVDECICSVYLCCDEGFIEI